MEDYTRTSTQSAAWFRSRYNDGTLDKRPPFQRLFVWSDRQQSALIETMLLGYPIPEVYMQEGVDMELRERYVLVDGQQRITSVLTYIDDEYKLDANVQAPFAGRRFSQLDGQERQTLLSYQFVVRTLPGEWGEERLREVFARLNRGVSSLNDQELRHATYWGPFIRLMEHLAEDPRWEDIRVFTANDVRRMLDVEYVSELVVATLFGAQNKKDDLDDFYVAYEQYFDQALEAEETVSATLRTLVDLFELMNSKRWRKKSDFYTLFLLLAGEPGRWRADVAAVAAALDAFAARVDEALSRLGSALVQSGEKPDVSLARSTGDAAVDRYVLAVRGAASDLSARQARLEALRTYLARSVEFTVSPAS